MAVMATLTYEELLQQMQRYAKPCTVLLHCRPLYTLYQEQGQNGTLGSLKELGSHAAGVVRFLPANKPCTRKGGKFPRVTLLSRMINSAIVGPTNFFRFMMASNCVYARPRQAYLFLDRQSESLQARKMKISEFRLSNKAQQVGTGGEVEIEN